EYPAMPQIRRYFDGGNRGQPDPGVMDLPLDNFAELDSKLFFYPVNSSSLHVCSHDFDIALNRALRRDSFRFLTSLLQPFFQELFVRSDGHDADLRTLPQFLMIHL